MTTIHRFSADLRAQPSRTGSGRVSSVLTTVLTITTVLTVTGGCVADQPLGTLREAVSFGANPGNLTMYEYVPSGLPADSPLVVVMHGCSQTASEYYNNAGWSKLADDNGFALVMPEQKTSNNSSRCFNWFESGDIQRGQGEALSIANMVDHMIDTYDLDPNRVFATGLSAGGAMTSVMMATYPDKFAGGAIMAGVVYGCANSMTSAFLCMSSPSGSPSQWGDAVRNATSHTGPWPVISIWHGTSDYTVGYANLQENLEQWTDVHGIDRTVDATGSVGGATRSEYRDANGTTLVETWSIDGMGHATAIDPGSADDQCGAPGAFISDEDVCSGYYAVQRWGIGNGFSGSGPDAGVGGEPDADPGNGPDADPGNGPDAGTGGEPDAGTGGEPDADPGPGGGHECTETTASNYHHVQAGRAYQSLGSTYAIGSDDAMGLYNVFYTNPLAETAPGYYEVGSCPSP